VGGGCLSTHEGVLAPVSTNRSEDKTIQERRSHRRGVRRLVRSPSAPRRQEAASEAAPEPSSPKGPDTLQLTACSQPAPCSQGPPPLRMLEEEGDHQPKRRVGPRLNPPPTTARMMNILEAEGGREAAARLASPHHKAGGHPPG
jgi:hypothetical protein